MEASTSSSKPALELLGAVAAEAALVLLGDVDALFERGTQAGGDGDAVLRIERDFELPHQVAVAACAPLYPTSPHHATLLCPSSPLRGERHHHAPLAGSERARKSVRRSRASRAGDGDPGVVSAGGESAAASGEVRRRAAREAGGPPASGGDAWGTRAAPAGVRAPAPSAYWRGTTRRWPTTTVLPLRSGLSARSSLVVVPNRCGDAREGVAAVHHVLLGRGGRGALAGLGRLDRRCRRRRVRAHHAGLHHDADEGDHRDEEDDGRRDARRHAGGTRAARRTGARTGARRALGPTHGARLARRRRAAVRVDDRRRRHRRDAGRFGGRTRRAHGLQAPQSRVRILRAGGEAEPDAGGAPSADDGRGRRVLFFGVSSVTGCPGGRCA